VESLLKEANPDGKYLGTTSFYKLLFLLSLRLKQKGLDLRLPFSWYRFGTMVERTEFLQATGVPLLFYAPQNESARVIRTVRPLDLEPHIKSEIDTEIHALLSEFPEKDYLENRNVEKYLDLVYVHAPLQFQKTFNRGLLKYLDEIKKSSHEISISQRVQTQDYFDQLIRNFPEEEFPELYDTYLAWDDTIRLALERNPVVVEWMATEFWHIFCRLLRTKYNENLSPESIDDLKTRFNEEELPDYQQRLNANRYEILEMHVKTVQDDPEINKVVNSIMKLSYELAFEDKID